jgi:hypothetical protein
MFALVARQARFGHDAVAGFEVAHTFPHLRNYSGEFVAHGDRGALSGPEMGLRGNKLGTVRVLVEIGGADAGIIDANPYFTWSRRARSDLLDANIAFSIPASCFHG